jgi:hypothetical protein
MNNPKSTNEAPPDPPRDNATPEAPVLAFAALMHRGIERLAEIQKSTIEVTTKHTADAMTVYRKAWNVPADAPAMALFDAVNQSLGKIADAQNGMVDLVVQQSARLLEISKVRQDSASRYTNGFADLLGTAADTAVAAQKLVLDLAADQNKAFAGAIKQQVGVAGSPPAVAAVDTLQRNMDAVIQTQREIVQAAAKPMKAAAGSSAA